MCSNKVTIRQEVLEERVIGTLRARLMRPELTEIFCKEYTSHLNKVRMEHNAHRAAREKEFRDIQSKIDKVIESIKAGIDVSLIKDEANALQRRKEQLEALLSQTEEAPVYVHPRMGDRYTKAVGDLIESLNDPNHRDASAKLLRELIDKIVLTPNEDRTALVADLYGDLAGILQVTRAVDGKIELKPSRDLDRDEVAEIQQVQELIKSAETQSKCGSEPSQVMLVAGANPQHALRPEKCQDSLGAHARNPLNLLFNAYDITDVRKKSAL